MLWNDVACSRNNEEPRVDNKDLFPLLLRSCPQFSLLEQTRVLSHRWWLHNTITFSALRGSKVLYKTGNFPGALGLGIPYAKPCIRYTCSLIRYSNSHVILWRIASLRQRLTNAIMRSWDLLWGSLCNCRGMVALRDFCGGIATIFANTATVESDFSVLGWEKDEYRMSLMDVSLEGIMQWKQFDLLSRLV